MADFQGRGRGGGRGGDRGGRGGDRGRGGRGGGGGDRGGGGYRGGGDRGGGGYRGGGGGGDRGGGGGGYRGGGDRGGGGYRGGGDRGGGGYRGGGDRGGGGYRGGGDRGGGGYRGGGDRGGATFSGYQSRGDGGRGRGRGRGGPGGFGGRPDKFAGEAEVFSIGPQVPQPNADINNLEDRLIKDAGVSALTSQVSKLQISDSSTIDVTDKNWFPCRPAYGSKGNKVVLWTNYFALEASSQVELLKYVLEVKRVEKRPEEDSKDGKGGKGNQKGKKGGKDAKKDDAPKGMKLHAIIKAALAKVGNAVPFATEFKANVIARAPLNLPDDKTIAVEYVAEGRDDTYNVKFLEPSTVNIPALMRYLQTMHDPSVENTYPKFADAIDAISTITGYYARSNPDSAAIGRSRYFMMNVAASEKLEMPDPELNRIFRGYFQSARPVTGRLLLNANVAHGVFRPTGPVPDLIKAFQGDLYGVNKTLGRLRARYKVFSDDKDPKKTRIVQKVMKGLASPGDGRSKRGGGDEKPPEVAKFGAVPREVKFYLSAPAPAGLQANTFCSVADYYKKRYGYTVKPDLPVIAFGTARPIYVPAELVEIVDGQPLPRKLTAEETREMIEFACRSPFANATSISTYGRQVLGLDKTEHLERFGIKVGKTLLTVHGRELAPPSVVYQDERGNKQKTIYARDGSWNMVNVRVFKPGTPMSRWFWISIEKEGPYAHQAYEEVKNGVGSWIEFMRKNMGISIAEKPLACSNNKVTVPRGQKVTAALRRVFEELKPQNPQFVFVVLPGRKTDTDVYNEVKKLCDTEYGYLSQNVLWANLRKGSLQLYANLGLKVNLKMGGINHKLTKDIPIINQNTMIVGYDVTHPTNLPGGGGAGLPSLVGMVSSVDSQLGQWPATAWAQASRQEMLDEVLEKRFAERLTLYRNRNAGKLPTNIVIYRDGVSEGQFSQVLTAELPLIRKACSALYPPKSGSPKISLIVSVKRHQTRFYPTDAGHMVKSRNIKDGTVVDRGVTLAHTWDFFLTAHSGLQGTSRPAHYTVLLDEIFRAKYSKEEAANELEKLTYEMCYLFGRATKAVSICPPAYYADILCTRARVYLSDMFDRATSDTQSVVSSATGATTETAEVKVHERIKDSMFYI